MQAAAPSTVPRRSPRPARSAQVRPHTVRVDGEVDLETGASIVTAVDRLRARHPGAPIIVDTSAVTFIDPAGYRALRSALSGADGTPDPLVSHRVGAAVLRLEVVIELVSRSR